MLLEFKVDHYKLFEQVDFTMEASPHIKTLSNNVTEVKDKRVLKTTAIFGPNNTGKSSFINALNLMVDIVTSGTVPSGLSKYKNLLDLNQEDTLSFEMSYVQCDQIYHYGFGIDYQVKEFSYEFLRTEKDEIFTRLKEKIEVNPKFKDLKGYSEFFSSVNKLFVKHVANTENEKFKIVTDAVAFYDKFIFLDASQLDHGSAFEKTFNLLENNKTSFINDLITKADVSIDSLNFDSEQFEQIHTFDEDKRLPSNFKKYLAIQATHRKEDSDINVPLILIESLGTKKLLALAGYLYEVFEEDKILIIDEIDSSFHVGLTRQIFSLFHLLENSKAQLIATTHDLLLLDLKFLFRKDQIWFAMKESNKGYLYSLDDFKANGQVNLRKNSDILKMYLNGVFGAMMYPDLASAMEAFENGEESV